MRQALTDEQVKLRSHLFSLSAQGARNRLVLDYLTRIYPASARQDDLLAAAYPDGSVRHVAHAWKTLKVILSRLRAELRPFGYTISMTAGGGPRVPQRFGVYRIEPIDTTVL
ncbi:hypothetical protein [Aminobacter sp. BE322]|uniref:hypothetical protein n=1 Tax=unclassified Aminobacter TaxID=2644704 RepID=UPI003D20C502